MIEYHKFAEEVWKKIAAAAMRGEHGDNAVLVNFEFTLGKNFMKLRQLSEQFPPFKHGGRVYAPGSVIKRKDKKKYHVYHVWVRYQGNPVRVRSDNWIDQGDRSLIVTFELDGRLGKFLMDRSGTIIKKFS